MAILLPFLAALLLIFFSNLLSRKMIHWFVFFVPTILFISFLIKIPDIISGETFYHVTEWIPSYNINFITMIDGLSMIFGLLITGIGSLVVLYSIYYLSTEPGIRRFFVYLLFFMGSMLGVVFSDHLMTLYVFWELTSISSFLLIAFWYQRKGSRYGAKKALMITIIGGLAMFIAFLMLYFISGTFSIREMISTIDSFQHHSLMTPIIILILLGAFTKSAQFPFHIWLPGAMEAPTPVSAYLHSATMVKAGIYVVARFTPIFGGIDLWFWIVSSVGLLTLFWGALTAIRQTDLKALLAYSTVSQLGLIMTLFGVSSLSYHPSVSIESVLFTQASVAALFHLINHSTFKGALFMVIGIIDYRVGTRDLRRLSGLISVLPISFTVALIGSFSMAGLPPFNGFLSKEMFFTAMLHLREFDFFSVQSAITIFPIIAWVASIFTFVYSMMIVFHAFFGPKMKRTAANFQEARFGMLIAPIILAALVIAIFFFPNIINTYLLKPAVQSIYPNISTLNISDIVYWDGFSTEFIMTATLIIVGIVIFIWHKQFIKIFTLFPRSLSFDELYNHSISLTEQYANRITKFYMTGFLRHYISYIFVFFTVILGSYFIHLRAFKFSLLDDQPMTIFLWMMTASIIVAGVTILFVSSRLAAILINGYIGFAIAILFVLFRAPDLALTQLVVETVTTALFLLCFAFLPEWKKENSPKKTPWLRTIISISVGIVFTTIALSVKSGRLFDSISAYFEQSYELTGATNIVNTILGDFRAFDTMLEVIVLFIAGIGVFTLIKYKSDKGVNGNED